MCGIAGFFNRADAAQKTLAALRIMKNRGSDFFGIADQDGISTGKAPEDIRAPKGMNALGHCLHSMVSFVPQPLSLKKSLFASNCEIYNWKELNKKHKFGSKNDSELLLRLLDKNETNALEELRGVYAFALWRGDTITLARDIVGEKPLWYSAEKGFCFASEKKALERQGVKNIVELNPRNILTYSISEDKLSFVERKFFETEPEVSGSLEKTAETLRKMVEKSVKERTPSQKVGLLFSGGLDSLVIAKALKDQKADFCCYVAGLEGSEDVAAAEDAAEKFSLPLKKAIIDEKKVAELLKTVVPLIEDNNVIKVGVGLTLYAACEKMKEDGIRVCFSGSGADELFGGYERHKRSEYLNKECLSSIRKIYEVNCYRDDVVTMNNSIELRTPFLDTEIVGYALRIPAGMKIRGEANKLALRKVAEKVKLGAHSERKKKAAQYGSKVDSVIEKLAKKEKKSKSEYLKQFYDPGNVKLGVLFSGGKDSVSAMETMMKQNYDVRCLITMQSENADSFMFHTPNISLTGLQAEAMGIPIITQKTTGEKEKELEDLRKAIARAVKEYGIEGVATGALYSNYQRNRIEKICDELNLKCFSPLWHADQEKYLRSLIEKGYEIWISSVAAEGLDKSWLGKPLTLKDVDRLAALNRKNGINVAGEGGEYESLVTFAPFFKKRIEIKKFEITGASDAPRMNVTDAALE